MCSTFHCNLHVSRHFDELHKIDLRKNELQWLLFAAWDKTLGIPCIYNASEGQCDLFNFMLCIICKMAFCGDHTSKYLTTNTFFFLDEELITNDDEEEEDG